MCIYFPTVYNSKFNALENGFDVFKWSFLQFEQHCRYHGRFVHLCLLWLHGQITREQNSWIRKRTCSSLACKDFSNKKSHCLFGVLICHLMGIVGLGAGKFTKKPFVSHVLPSFCNRYCCLVVLNLILLDEVSFLSSLKNSLTYRSTCTLRKLRIGEC